MSDQPVSPDDRTQGESPLPPPMPPPLPMSPVTLSLAPALGLPHTLAHTARGEAVLPRKRLGRFEIHGEIGRGGMGAVLRGHDPALGRELALKVLLTGHQEDPATLRRFHEEAQIGGQLQHPGLVPVYEMGTDGDGRPFFAMKLVDGQTLAVLLKERNKRTDNLPHFLTIFEQVCQAVAYAHARGVIHRDLKPGNVMVGAFGEVQVMDWGLARLLAGGGLKRAEDKTAALAAATNPHEARRGSEATVAGTVLGTPAYMPPEQARGETDRLDERADVFGLGAILCEILTGLPPYVAREMTTVLLLAADCDQSAMWRRLDACGADPDLIALARACLAPEPENRPRDASEVATRLSTYRVGVAERLRRSELERAAAEVRAVEERRRRRVQLVLAAAVLLLLTLVGGVAWYVRQNRLERQTELARQETAKVRQEVELTRAVEEDFSRLARAREEGQWDEVAKILERVQGRLGKGGDDELRKRVASTRDDLNRVRKDQQMVARLEEARLQLAEAGADDGFDKEGSRKRLEEAFAWYGLDVKQDSPDAIAARIVASPIREEIVIGLARWSGLAATADAQLLRSIADRADANEWRRRLRGAQVNKEWDLIRGLADEAKLDELPPASIVALADALRRAKATERALAVLLAGQQQHPSDFWLNFELAQTLRQTSPSRTAEAVRYYTVAQALHPDSLAVNVNLGNALLVQGKAAEAEAACRRAVRIQPDFYKGHLSLAFVLKAQGKLPEALDAYRAHVRLKPDSYLAHVYLAEALKDRADYTEALEVIREAIRLKPDSYEAYNGLGIILGDQKKYPEAEAALRESIRLKPGNYHAHNNLGNTLRHRGKLPEAVAAYRESIRLKPDNHLSHNNLGLLLQAQNKLPEAAAAFHEAIRLKPDYGKSHINLAAVLRVQKRYAAVVRLSAEAFQSDASVANDLDRLYRYHAASSAVLLATGKGDGPKPFDEAERAQARTQALGWLRADLAAWGKRLDDGKPTDRALVEGRMRLWQKDPELAAVREAADVAKLPEAERAEWQKLWQDVEALAKRAGVAK